MLRSSVQPWFDELQGRPPGGGGIRPASGNPLSEALANANIIRPQIGGGGGSFQAPPIRSNYRPTPIAPNPGLPSPVQQIVPEYRGGGGGTPNLGGGAKAAGLEKLGQGVEKALKAIGDKRRQQQAYQQQVNANRATPDSKFLTQPTSPPPSTGGRSVAPGASPATTPYTPSPVGPSGGAPSLTTPDLESQRGPVPPIGALPSSLPTLAQGVPGGTATAGGPLSVGQFLTGIKAGEGVPYSGQSSTGAIGAYGLTGDFIKQWAPGAGLPTDRASYTSNPGLQDQLAAHAATQMHNQYGSWPSVANAWLTGSPTATTSAPGNMSPHAYVDKVMNAANAAPGVPAPAQTGPAAYAAMPPSTAAPIAQPVQAAGPAMPPPGGAEPGPTAPDLPTQITPGQPQTGPAYSDQTWNNRPQYDYSAPATGAANVPVPPPQPPLLNGGQPGVYSMPDPGPQGMNDQGGNPLAAALANGDPNNPGISPGIVSMLNGGDPFGFGTAPPPDVSMPPVSADFAMPDFNFGGFNFG